MKKSIKKWISTLLCLTTLPLAVFTGCASEEEVVMDSYKPNQVSYTGGIHNLTATETSKWFVQDGYTEYKILLPADSNTTLIFARDELYTRFYEATGIRLISEMESGDGVSHSPNAKYISLGNTKMFESAGITLDESVLGYDGVRIVTKDDTIYINGGKKNGTLYGVYDFLEIYFDYEWFYHDCYSLKRGVTDLKLLAFDVTDVPDIKNRMGSSAYTNSKDNTNRTIERFRYNWSQYGGSNGMFIPGAAGHNTSRLINASTPNFDLYGADWMSDNGNQLCYTAHGDEDAYNEMVTQITAKFAEWIIANESNPAQQIDLSITIEDNVNICTCDTCMGEREKYGSPTGSVIKLTNACMERLKDVWMESEEGLPYKNEEIRCCFFAYSQMVTPPTTVWNEETKKYELVHDELKMRDDVGVWICFSSQESAPLYPNLSLYAKENENFRVWLSQWMDISSFAHTWGYQANFYNYIDFYNSFDLYSSSELFQFMVDKDVEMWFCQNTGNSTDVTGFSALKEYLQSELQWDCTQNVEELMDDFFTAMYAEGASAMRELFDYSKMMATQLRIQCNKPAAGSLDTVKTDLQPIPVLRKKMAYCDEALAIVETLYKEQDPAKYETLKFHIDLEWLSPTYHLLNLHGDTSLSAQEYSSLANRLYIANQKMKPIYVSEHAVSDIKNDIIGWASK